MAETKTAPGVRARVRAQLTAEIKDLARQQLRDVGAAGLSLRAIARELEMASSAIYRYFPSRDALLTALIIDAYNDLGVAVEEADAAVDREHYHGRWASAAGALRSWAIANPQQWALIYGSPVPGYAAPQDTIAAASRLGVVLLTIVSESTATTKAQDAKTSRAVSAAVAGIRNLTDGTIADTVLVDAVGAWSQLIGLVSMELFGHFVNVVDDVDVYYAEAVRRLGSLFIPST